MRGGSKSACRTALNAHAAVVQMLLVANVPINLVQEYER